MKRCYYFRSSYTYRMSPKSKIKIPSMKEIATYWWWQITKTVVFLFLIGFHLILASYHANSFEFKSKVNYTLSELRGQNFSGQDLSGTSFAGADMRRADFHGAILEGTILTKAYFLQANIGGANFAQAFSDHVTFDKSDLTNAIFTDSLLNW